MASKRQYSAVDAVLLLVLAARLHGTDEAVRATAKRILPKIPQADRPGIRRFITAKYPLRVAELLLDCWAVVHVEEQPPSPRKDSHATEASQ